MIKELSSIFSIISRLLNKNLKTLLFPALISAFIKSIFILFCIKKLIFSSFFNKLNKYFFRSKEKSSFNNDSIFV